MSQPLDVVWPEPDGTGVDYTPVTNGTMFDPLTNAASEADYYGFTHQEVDYRGDNNPLTSPNFPTIDAGVKPDPAVGQLARPGPESPFSIGPVGNADGSNVDVDRPARHVYWRHDLEGWTGPVGQADGRADVLGSVAYGIASSSATIPTDDEVTAMLLTMQATDYATL